MKPLSADSGFIMRREWSWIHGLEQLMAYVEEFPPERAESLTWVPAAKIIEAARLYAGHGPGSMLTSAQGTTHDRNATNNHRALLMIPAICGYRAARGHEL
ncbi:MAG: hypothetical protein R6X08_09460 [Desulfosalsimonadaceae bacterium]